MTTAPALEPTEARASRRRPQLPRQRAVLLELLRTTGLTLRAPALVAAALLAGLTLWVALESAGRTTGITLNAWPTQLPGLMGVLMPIAVWARDERFGPGFLWTLPVDRRHHALTKVVAGWLWLMGGVALFVLWLLAVTSATGGGVLPPETLHVLSSPLAAAPLDPATLRAVRWEPGPLIWAVPFTAATACYLFASALALGCRHPLRWVIGAVVAYVLATVASTLASAQLGMGWLDHAPGRLLDLLFDSRYGLDALLTARLESLGLTATLTTGERIMAWRAVPALADWGAATVLWTGAGLLALWAAASRHRERRRG